MKSVEQQFLAGYLCASLYYLIEDAHSRHILLADNKASAAVTTALLTAASSTAVMVRPQPAPLLPLCLEVGLALLTPG